MTKRTKNFEVTVMDNKGNEIFNKQVLVVSTKNVMNRKHMNCTEEEVKSVIAQLKREVKANDAK